MALWEIILDHLALSGYDVRIEHRGDRGRFVATDLRTGQHFIAEGMVGGEYDAACDLAERVGIDLES